MSNATPSRLGFLDGASDASWAQDNAMFLKIFGGEVMAAFATANKAKDLHLMRSIKAGKSAQFPASWKAGAAYHTPGNQLLGAQTIKHNERIIYIDDVLVADTFVAEADELKNHYDVRRMYSTELGEALAREFDKRAFQTAVLAARASATVSGGNGGSAFTNASAKTDGEVLAGMIFSAAQAMDEKDVPEDRRYCIVKPAQYYLLAQTTKLINKDWGGAGVYADGSILKVGGISIVKSNHLPTSLINAVSGENNVYNGDFSKTAAVCFQEKAIGTVKRMDLTVQQTAPDGDYAAMYLGTLFVAKYMLGTGILRPECAVELATP